VSAFADVNTYDVTMPKNRAEKQEETRRQLLDAALEVFIDKGFHAASVDAIARHAGYTKGAVYANFDNKEALFLAMVDRRLDQGVNALANFDDIAHTGELPSPDGAERLQTRWALLSMEAVLYAVRNSPELLTELAERYQRIDRETEQHITDRGEEPPESTRLLAIAESSLGSGLMIRHLMDPDGIDMDTVDRVFDVVLSPRGAGGRTH
jgi:AcrR family transcriptional regulator